MEFLHFSTCEGVHERGQGPVEHLKERIPARILLRSTQDRVLQDVGDPGAVRGGGPELDAETKCKSEYINMIFFMVS